MPIVVIKSAILRPQSCFTTEYPLGLQPPLWAPSFVAWHSFILFAWNFTQRCYCMCPLIEQSLNKICQLSKCNVTLSDVALWGSLSWRCGKWWDCEIDSSLLHCPFLISFFFLIELNEYYYRAMRPPVTHVITEKLSRSRHLSHSAVHTNSHFCNSIVMSINIYSRWYFLKQSICKCTLHLLHW